jgi:uncharacterized phage protein (TIGR02220 family)
MMARRRRGNSSRRYRKFEPRFWRDEKIRGLETIDKAVAAYILTGQSNRIGCYSFSPGMAAEDLGMSYTTCATRVRHVCTHMRWKWDEAGGVIYLPTWWKSNPPENPSVLVSNLRDLDDVPDSPVVIEFCANLTHLDPGLRDTFRTRVGPRVEPRDPPRGGDQEQEQKQEQKQEQGRTTSSGLPPRPHLVANGNGSGPGPTPRPRSRDQAAEVLAYLNQRAGRSFRPVASTLELIEARLKTGATVDDCKAVIARKISDWRGDPKMAKYLRPETLFNRTKFESYLGEAPIRGSEAPCGIDLH